MKSKQFANPAIIIFFTIIIIGIVTYACSKSGYGSNYGGNGNGNNISIKDSYFSVSSLSVSSGTTVTWTNNGANTHTVTADDNSFNSGDILPGKTFSKTFSTAGTFNYHCKYHSVMKASIVVQY